MKTPIEIVQLMLEKDAFSKLLGMEVLQISEGSCQLSMTISKELLNGFHIAHGGICYSLADSALAFAANSYGFQCVSIETSISHVKKVLENDCLTAKVTELNRNSKTALYEVIVSNQAGIAVAFFKGTVMISSKIW
jgi:acyl-CoA thioesterase